MLPYTESHYWSIKNSIAYSDGGDSSESQAQVFS